MGVPAGAFFFVKKLLFLDFDPTRVKLFEKKSLFDRKQLIFDQKCSSVRKPIFLPKTKKMRLENPYTGTCLTIPSLFSRYVSSSKTVLRFWGKSADSDDDDVPTTLESGQAPIPIAPRDKIRRSGKPLPPIICFTNFRKINWIWI